ncbi:MAG: hypothetical protein WCJ30_04950 [Deltaproteobacteria bacterium]
MVLVLAPEVGCRWKPEVHQHLAVRSSDMQVAAIPPPSVGGSIDGQAFHLRTAWYRVERRAGRERVDLILSEGTRARLCGDSTPERAREVWLRFPGVTSLQAGVQRVDPPAATPFSIHYERIVDDRWRGHTGGAAVVSLDVVERTTISGRLRACFDDTSASCLSGTFRAEECQSELDLDSPISGGASRGALPTIH